MSLTPEEVERRLQEARTKSSPRSSGRGPHKATAAPAPKPEPSLLDGVEPDEIKPPVYRKGMLVDPLTKLYTGAGMMLMPFDQHCAATIMQHAEPMARSLDELARTNPQVRKVLMKMIQGSAVGMVIAAHAPLVIAVAVHHVPAVRDRMAAMGLADVEKFTEEQGKSK